MAWPMYYSFLCHFHSFPLQFSPRLYSAFLRVSNTHSSSSKLYSTHVASQIQLHSVPLRSFRYLFLQFLSSSKITTFKTLILISHVTRLSMLHCQTPTHSAQVFITNLLLDVVYAASSKEITSPLKCGLSLVYWTKKFSLWPPVWYYIWPPEVSEARPRHFAHLQKI